MLFVRREVLAPGQKPLPLPEGAREARVGPDEELKTLPNPFLMGTQKPPEKKKRPTEMSSVSLRFGHVVHSKGGVFENHYVKTRPGNSEWWVLLVGGELADLPAAKRIASARLCIPVTMSHAKANVKVGATALRKNVTAGASFKESEIGDVLGTTVVPKRPKPGPAKLSKIDVTRYVKSVAAGEATHRGFGVKVLPDRNVDDGWTVRIDVSKTERMYLELEVFTD
jgi:hypothetical protein